MKPISHMIDAHCLISLNRFSGGSAGDLISLQPSCVFLRLFGIYGKNATVGMKNNVFYLKVDLRLPKGQERAPEQFLVKISSSMKKRSSRGI